MMKSSILHDFSSVQVLKSAFPLRISASVENALRVVPRGQQTPVAGDAARVFTNQGSFRPLRRVYSDYVYAASGGWSTQARWKLTGLEQDILACIYSVHHDGLVRVQTVNRLMRCDQEWALAYLLNLLGEYVIEIGELIDYRRHLVSSDRMAEFAALNPVFLRRICSRVVSYWHAQSRHAMHWGSDHPTYERLSDHPGYRALSQWGIWPTRCARKLRRKESRNK